MGPAGAARPRQVGARCRTWAVCSGVGAFGVALTPPSPPRRSAKGKGTKGAKAAPLVSGRVLADLTPSVLKATGKALDKGTDKARSTKKKGSMSATPEPGEHATRAGHTSWQFARLSTHGPPAPAQRPAVLCIQSICPPGGRGDAQASTSRMGLCAHALVVLCTGGDRLGAVPPAVPMSNCRVRGMSSVRAAPPQGACLASSA